MGDLAPRLKPLRIMHIIGQLHKGGAERQLYLLGCGQVDQGHHVTVVSLSEGGFWEEPLRAAGIQVLTLARRGKREFRRLVRLRRLIRAQRPDLLHTWMWEGNSYGRLAALGLSHVCVLASERTVDPTRRPWQHTLDRWLTSQCDRVVANSRKGGAWVHERGIPTDKIGVVYNGLQPAPPLSSVRAAQLRQELQLPAGAPLVLAAGRCSREKRFEDFLECCQRVADGHDSVVFLLAGDGVLLPALQERHRQLGLGDRFQFLGIRDDLGDLMQLASLVMLTSAYEGLSNVLMEAALLGRPIVASRATGNDEIVLDGISGSLAPVGDVALLAEGVLRLLRDPAWAASAGQAGQQHAAERFSLVPMLIGWESEYQAALAHQRK